MNSGLVNIRLIQEDNLQRKLNDVIQNSGCYVDVNHLKTLTLSEIEKYLELEGKELFNKAVSDNLIRCPSIPKPTLKYTP